VLKPELVRYSGRKQRPEQIQRTADFCAQHGLRCSVDLITGWFDQTPQDVVEDIVQLASWGVTGIVNHLLTLAGDSEFARRSDELPPVEVTRRTFLTARETLMDLGYRADSYTDHCRSDLPVVQFLEMYRDILHNDRVGVGYGANSLLSGSLTSPGHTYKNVTGLGPYRDRIVDGDSCIESSFRFDEEDLRLLYVLKGLEGTPFLSATDYRATFGSDLQADFEPWWDELARRGWLVWRGDQPRLVGEGTFYTAAIQRCITEPRNADLRQQRAAG
jgi:coproporphyrinogen III oxidase-like Fe-S oxidoreductase